MIYHRNRRRMYAAILGAAAIGCCALIRPNMALAQEIQAGAPPASMTAQCLPTGAAEDDGDAWRTIFSNEALYPPDLLRDLKRNPEMLDFVSGYLSADKCAAGSLTTAEKAEKCPLFIQWDKRWGYLPYGGDIIGVSGCGPTCLSMVLHSLTRDETLTPDVLAKKAMDGGYFVEGAGTAWSFMTDIPPQYGIFAIQEALWTREALQVYLGDGKLLICSMGPGDFTDAGHFIVITGFDQNGKLLVNDPFSYANSNKAWDCDTIIQQCNQVWSFEAPVKTATE